VVRHHDDLIEEAPASRELFDRAQRVLVGGVNSPVRSFRGVGGTPRFIVRGHGATLEDADGHRYIDFVMSWGALILGHAHASVVRAVQDAAERGTSYGAPTEAEVALAERISRDLPSIERMRFVNSGTEATMSAIRVARAFTRRRKIVVFEGGYHGHADPFLVRAGSGVAAAGLARSEGVPPGALEDTLVATYNDGDGVAKIFRRSRKKIAAVVVEPVAGNMGVVPPLDDFLPTLRDITTEHDSLLIFDEVITGYRVSRHGAQGLYRIDPDLTCLGKIIGGGLPAAVYGGREDAMSLVAPLGPVYQAGTLAGNPLAMAAGLATIHELADSAYSRLESISARFERDMRDAAAAAGVPIQTNRVGSMFGVFFSAAPVRSYADVKASDADRYRRLFASLLARGVYFPPAPYESLFVSLAHDEESLRHTADALAESFAQLGRGPWR